MLKTIKIRGSTWWSTPFDIQIQICKNFLLNLHCIPTSGLSYLFFLWIRWSTKFSPLLQVNTIRMTNLMVSSVPLYRAREFELIALCVVSGIFLEQRATPFWRLTGPVITQAILECNLLPGIIIQFRCFKRQSTNYELISTNRINTLANLWGSRLLCWIVWDGWASHVVFIELLDLIAAVGW